MSQRTKDMFEDCGVIKVIATNGLAVFDYAPVINGKKSKKEEELKLSEKCAVGDRVVKYVDKPRGFFTIPAKEWEAMPATANEAKEKQAETSVPQLGEIMKRLESLEAENKALKEQINTSADKEGDK